MEISMTAVFGAWIAVTLSLCIFSFLYKETPLFRFAEHLYMGITVGYGLSLMIFNVWIPKVIDPLSVRDWSPVIPAIIGASLLTRIHPKFSWISRFGFAFIMGYGAGLSIPASITTSFLKQIEGTIQPLLKTGVSMSGMAAWSAFSALIVAVGVVCVLFYFFFSVEQKGIYRKIPKVGIYFLMVYLGASFGATVMGRFSLLYGRFFDIYNYSAQRYYYATPVLLLALVAFMYFYNRKIAAQDKKEAAE